MQTHIFPDDDDEAMYVLLKEKDWAPLQFREWSC